MGPLLAAAGLDRGPVLARRLLDDLPWTDDADCAGEGSEPSRPRALQCGTPSGGRHPPVPSTQLWWERGVPHGLYDGELATRPVFKTGDSRFESWVPRSDGMPAASSGVSLIRMAMARAGS